MTGFKGAEEAMIDRWVKSRLNAHTAFNVINAGLATRVFNRLAPAAASYPFIVFQAQSPPMVIRGVGPAEVMVDTIYVVKAIAQGNDFDALAPVASAIRDALLSDNGEAITGAIGTIFTCRYERAFSLTEADQDNQFRHLGGEFKIQAQAA